MLQNFLKILKKENIGEPPYKYDFLISLDEKEYPKYLKKTFKAITGKDLNLKHPKSFNEKIQWLKLYDLTEMKTSLTDKVLVRDWVKVKIGEEYLKPVLWIGKSFDEIPFNTLPDSFIIKANHGCKWHYKIKDKKTFLEKEELFNFIKMRFDGWMKQTFFPWAGFEMQYKNIKPQILIEPIMIDKDKAYPIEYEIYCFNGKPKIYQKIKYSNLPYYCIYDEFFNECDITFNPNYIRYYENAENNLKLAVELSELLCKEFPLVRVDWLIHNNKLYFNEMTFTPFSGFFQLDDETNLKLGKMLDLKKGMHR